jgi:outer membrane receptor protein involved in Fe transport
MFNNSKLAKSVRLAMALGVASTAVLSQGSAFAQENTGASEVTVEKISVTGSRIVRPGAVSASPIMSMDAEDIEFLQEPEVEKILRILPSTIPGDGANVNNGTAGAATVDLRGLGTQRTLVLLNGRRMVPFNFNGQVDTATIPTALIERVDVVTGGASAVYGSDAVAGAVNFVLKENFEGVALDYNHAVTAESDGKRDTIALTIGSNFDDDRGNMALSISWMNREQILLGDRPLGLLGIVTSNGAGFDQFNAGEPPVPSPAGCDAPNAVVAGGSTTSIPTRFAIVGGGAAASGQFRNDGSIGTECSQFNFNPFNFYQTPQERFSATAIGHYDINDDHRAYASFTHTNVTVDQQIAPSGTFGAVFQLPLANPLIADTARQFMITQANNALANGLLSADPSAPVTNWRDVNGNGVVDEADYLSVQLRRRTLELGPRSEKFDTEQFQFVVGAKGVLYGDWEYDVSYQYGESNRVTTRGGYTNLTNIQNALDTTDGVTCANGDSSCVPINLFGGFGTITPEMAGYATAIALQTQNYDQTVGQVILNGPVDFVVSPFSSESLLMSVGYEHRAENGSLEPDECLKLAPASCQGGAGGNLLPIRGGFKADEFFIEGLLPLVTGMEFAEQLDLEFGYRAADYDSVGSVNTWKLGLTWRPTDDLLVRVMEQSATRAPNVGELFSPVVTGLDNAAGDPCSIGNAANIDAALTALCVSTGMSPAQVGQVQDVISGQINTITGSDPTNVPGAEDASTFTAGFVYSSDILDNFSISVDYYDITIEDTIGNFSAQETLDSCYVAGIAAECAKIQRVAGDLTISGSGIELLTTNLNYRQAEGIEIGVNFDYDLNDMGALSFSTNLNQYLTNERQSSAISEVIDCNGFYGTDCSPTPELRFTQRVTWSMDDITVSALWRYMSSIDVEEDQRAGVFEAFRSIDSYSYFDLFASYQLNDNFRFTAGVENLFDKEPPVVGGEVGSTTFNSGNTFPSTYDVIGTVYKVGVRVKF